MAEIAVIDGEQRQIDVGTFRKNLDRFSADRITLKHGNIDAPIPPRYDLSSYRSLYVRVGEVSADVLDRADNVEIVSTCGSGYDHIDVGAATDHDILVTHTPEAPAPGAVEHTFGFIFTLLNDFPRMFERTASGGWAEGQTVVKELHGRTLGVVGLGTIGSQVASIASKSFNADVIAYDPYVDGTRESDIYPRTDRAEIESEGVQLVDFVELFQRASVVTMHVPLTDETESMVELDQFEALEGGYFINLSRGEVINEQDLVDAVRRDLLAGAALDVMDSEPPDPTHPLLSEDRVYVTPHIAGGKEGYPTRSAEINAQRITKALSGQTPGGIVNPQVL